MCTQVDVRITNQAPEMIWRGGLHVNKYTNASPMRRARNISPQMRTARNVFPDALRSSCLVQIFLSGELDLEHAMHRLARGKVTWTSVLAGSAEGSFQMTIRIGTATKTTMKTW